MTVQPESVTFTSGDGETRVPSYLATPDRHGPHPVVLILRGVAATSPWYTAGRFAGPTRRTNPCTPICRER